LYKKKVISLPSTIDTVRKGLISGLLCWWIVQINIAGKNDVIISAMNIKVVNTMVYWYQIKVHVQQ
jgi:hypothetical protein